MKSENKPIILLIESCNYNDYPIGGHLTFSKQMMEAFGYQLALAGISTDETEVGRWTTKYICGVEYDYFSFSKQRKLQSKPLIPLRVKTFLAILKHRNKILEKPIKNIFIQTPEVLLALPKLKQLNICMRIAGVENPLLISRYWYGKYFAKILDFIFFRKLKKSNCILASSDKSCIESFVQRSKGVLKQNHVFQFPTRVNSKIFFKQDMHEARQFLSIDHEKTLIITVGRLSTLKGWKYMIDCFEIFKNKYSDSELHFIGDGEDFKQIKEYINKLNLNESIYLVGRKDQLTISKYLNAANLFIMGSLKEGWSTSLIEAISCGTPSCVTNFSSAKEILTEGVNGYIAPSNNEYAFVKLMDKCLLLSRDILPIQSDIQRYSIDSLKTDLLKIWSLN